MFKYNVYIYEPYREAIMSLTAKHMYFNSVAASKPALKITCY